MSITQKKLAGLAAFILGIAFLTAVLMFDWDSINSYVKFNSESLHYVKGRVVSITSERLSRILQTRSFTSGNRRSSLNCWRAISRALK